MSYLDDFKARMNVNGNSMKDSQFHSSERFINSTFPDSPFYHIGTKSDGTQIELRLGDISTVTRSADIQPIVFTIKFAYLKPNVSVNIGEVIQINNDYWLVSDFTLEQPLYPRAKIQHCNYSLPIKVSETKVLKGYDSLGKPVYQITPVYDNLHAYVKDYIGSTNLNDQVNVVVGKIFITIPYNATSKLVKESDVLTLYNKNYKVISINMSNVINEIGCITLMAERVVV